MEKHEYILSMSKNILKDIEKKISKEELESKYSEFKNTYPKTWKHILSGNFSIIEFKKMVDIYNSAIDNKKSSDQATKEVGDYLNGKYISPLIK